MTQWVNVHGHPTLVFFDSGATSSIISQDLASKQGVEKISSNSVTLNVVGGDEISNTTGIYRLALGPSMKNEYFEMYCTGLPEIAVEFPQFPTHHVYNDIKKFMPSFKERLPHRLGGGQGVFANRLKGPLYSS